jgi:hypothetical protein
MTTIEPATLHSADDPRLTKLAAELTGDPVTRARYRLPSGTDLAAEDVHDIGSAVELALGSGRVLALSWGTPGLDEGLAIEVREDGTDDDRVDVSDDPHWSAVVGNPIEELAVAFFEYHYDSSVRPWSFRVSVSGGGSATVALGETDGAEISYLPDNLVVIFDEARARDYRIVDALQSAWGTPIGG